MYLNKAHFKSSRIFKNTLSFIYCNKTENFGGFQVEIFLFEEVGNFRDFRVFDLALIQKLETRKTRKLFQDL